MTDLCHRLFAVPLPACSGMFFFASWRLCVKVLVPSLPRIALLLALLAALLLPAFSALAQGEDVSPPAQTVRLVFIHHSTGENWLADGNGGLGAVLADNNYFVSDTNYGWGPRKIGDRTDIPDWLEWFRGPRTERITAALYAEDGQNAAYTRLDETPGGENQIILIKSCYPNSMLAGSPTDPPAAGEGLTVSNAKYVYAELLVYFRARPDKLFVVITAPPVQDPSLAPNARAFNDWLVNDWLAENEYPFRNVAVFDFYNLLTSPQAHHRILDGQVEHTVQAGMDTNAYPSAPADDHPSPEGNRKATAEFVPWLNAAYHRWQNDPASQSTPLEPPPARRSPLGCFSSLPLALVAVSALHRRSRPPQRIAHP